MHEIKINDRVTAVLTYDEIRHAWNAQADEHNHWDSLGEDEKIERAFDCAACLSVVTADLMKALKLIANSENSALDLAYCKGIARAAIANALREQAAEAGKYESLVKRPEGDSHDD